MVFDFTTSAHILPTMQKPMFILVAGAAVAVVAAAAVFVFTGSPIVPPPEKEEAKSTTAPHTATTQGNAAANPFNITSAATASDTKLRPLSFERRQSVERAGFDAADDLDKALGQLAEITAPNERAAFIRGLFEHLSTGDRKTAMAALNKLKDSDRATAATSLIDSWQPEARSRFQRDGRIEGFLGYALLDKDPTLAADWAQQVLTGDASRELMNRAIQDIAKQNPQAALEYGKDLTGKDRSDFLRRVASGWGQKNPDEALAWAGKETDPELRTSITASAIRGIAENDPAAAASHLASLAPGDDRTRTIERITEKWVGKDVASAEAFIGTLADAGDQKTAQRALDQAAPIGIGVQVRPSRDGGLVVQDVPDGSTTGLKPNDRIVAITRADGQTLGTINFREAIGVLRGGQRGSTVALTVASEGSTATRTVNAVLDRFPAQDGGRGGFGGGGGGRRGQ